VEILKSRLCSLFIWYIYQSDDFQEFFVRVELQDLDLRSNDIGPAGENSEQSVLESFYIVSLSASLLLRISVCASNCKI